MSMVGPRPANLVKYQALLEKGITTKAVIKAGLTGHQQSQKGANKKSDAELDQEYIDFCRTHSPLGIVLFDIRILLRSLKVVCKAKGI